MSNTNKIWKNSKFKFSSDEINQLEACNDSEQELILLFKIFKSKGFIKYDRDKKIVMAFLVIYLKI